MLYFWSLPEDRKKCVVLIALGVEMAHFSGALKLAECVDCDVSGDTCIITCIMSLSHEIHVSVSCLIREHTIKKDL